MEKPPYGRSTLSRLPRTPLFLTALHLSVPQVAAQQETASSLPDGNVSATAPMDELEDPAGSTPPAENSTGTTKEPTMATDPPQEGEASITDSTELTVPERSLQDHEDDAPITVTPQPHVGIESKQVAAPAPQQPQSPPLEVTGAPGKGLTIQVGEVFSLNIKSRIQLRYQYHIPPGGGEDAPQPDQLVTVSTLRLYFAGNVFTPELGYTIQLAVAGRDYRDGATSPIYDAFLDYTPHRDFNIRAGQYFVPFDRLRTVREFALQMGERPRPVGEFTLDRDVGVMAYSDHFLADRSPLGFRVGVFGGKGTNLTVGSQPGALVVGRVELHPLGDIDADQEGDLERRPKPRFVVGGAFAANFNTTRLRSTTGATFVDGTTDYLHAAADLVFKWRGWAAQAEYLWRNASTDTLISESADGDPTVQFTRSGQGWVLQTSYTFDPPFELVARLSRMYATSGTDPNLITEVEDFGQELGAGLNYYFNGHRMKLQSDWIARMPPGFVFDEADHLMQLLFDVTF